MSEYKRFTKNVGIVGVAQILMSLRGLILIPVIAKTLGASLFGVYSTLLVTVNFLAPIALLGLETSLVRFLSGEKNKRNIQEGYYSVLSIVLFSSLFFSLLVVLFSQALAETVFGDPNAAGVIKVGAFMILLFALDKINLEFFRAAHKMFLFSFLPVLETVGEVAFVVVLLMYGFGLDAVIYSFLFLRFLLFAVTLVFILKDIGFKKPDFSLVRPYLVFGLPLIPTAFFGWVMNSSDRYFVGFFLGAYYTGIYSAAYGIASAINLFVSPLQTVLLPTASKLWEEKRISELKTHLSYSFKYFLLLIIPSFFGVSVLSWQVLALMTRSEFASLGYSVIPIVALAMVFYFSLYGIYGLIFTLVKRTEINAILLGISSVLNIGLNLVLIPDMGIVGAALATLVSFVFVGVSTVVVSRKYLTFVVDLVFVGKSVLASFVMAAVLWVWAPAGLISVALSVPAGAAIYFVALVLLGGFKKTEVEFFRGFFAAALSKFSE